MNSFYFNKNHIKTAKNLSRKKILLYLFYIIIEVYGEKICQEKFSTICKKKWFCMNKYLKKKGQNKMMGRE